MAESRLVSILGTGSYLPEKVLTNDDLSRMVDTSDEWIVSRTGIRQRRVAEPGTGAAALGVHACRQALQSADVQPADIGLIICATMSPDYMFPASACLIQNELGAKNAAAFDVSAACSGYLYGLATGAAFVASGAQDKVLVVGAEMMSGILDWEDRSTCVIFGDGAGAAVLGASSGGAHIGKYRLYADGSGAQMLYMPAGGTKEPATAEAVEKRDTFLKMRGRDVFKFAVKTLVKTVREAAGEYGIAPEDFSLMIPHQMNTRIIAATAERCGIPQEKIFVNIGGYGNTSAASIGIALDEAVRGGEINKGDKVLTIALGAGYTWGYMVLEW